VDLIGLAIKAGLAEAKISITDAAPTIGLTYHQLSNIINGRTKPDLDAMEQLRKKLGKPRGWPFQADLVLRSLAGTPLAELPIVGVAAAGAGTTKDRSEDSMLVPAHITGPGRRGYIAEGISMLPHIYPDDTLVIKESTTPKKRKVSLILDESGPRLKEIVYQGSDVILHSYNPNFPDEVLSTHTQLLGYVVGLYRIDGSRETILHDPEGLVFE
jgi:SOS-response transcriptional repressor LexA